MSNSSGVIVAVASCEPSARPRRPASAAVPAILAARLAAIPRREGSRRVHGQRVARGWREAAHGVAHEVLRARVWQARTRPGTGIAGGPAVRRPEFVVRPLRAVGRGAVARLWTSALPSPAPSWSALPWSALPWSACRGQHCRGQHCRGQHCRGRSGRSRRGPAVRRPSTCSQSPDRARRHGRSPHRCTRAGPALPVPG